MLIVCYFGVSMGSSFLTQIQVQYVHRDRRVTDPRSSRPDFSFNSMANSALQRVTWSVQRLRISCQFAASFTTAIPRNARLRNLNEEAARSTPGDISPRSSPTHGQTRSIFTSGKHRQDLEVKATANSKVHHNLSTFKHPHSNTSPLQDSSPTEVQSLTEGLYDNPLILDEGSRQVDWARSFHGLSTEAFPPEAVKILLAPLDPNDVEVKPDGIIYLPEIKYRRVLNKAFGPGAWGLAPRGETIVTPQSVTREYALVVLGRLDIHSSVIVPNIKSNPLLVGLFPLLEVNRIISARKPLQPLSKVASPMQ